jgi:hypothetical protein
MGKRVRTVLKELVSLTDEQLAKVQEAVAGKKADAGAQVEAARVKIRDKAAELEAAAAAEEAAAPPA